MTSNLFKMLTVNIIFLLLYSCSQNQNSTKPENTMASSKASCDDKCTAKNQSKEMSCKLTTPELRERKETVIASLKKKVIEKKELKNGYAFRFAGTDNILDELTEFIKTERECCDFFTFAISVSGDKSEAWLELTGADGVKEFITAELGF